MKKCILIVVVLFYQNVFCQIYTFDRFIQYNNDIGATRLFMFNSKNAGYYFIAVSYSKEITGNIVDLENKFLHKHVVSNIKNAVKFEYLNTSLVQKSAVPCLDKDNLIEVVQTPVDSLTTTFSVLKYKNSKNKTIIQSSNIKAIKSEIPVFSIMMKYFFYHFVYCQKIDFPENFLPTSVEIDYFNGNKSRDELIQNKQVNVILSLKASDIKLKN